MKALPNAPACAARRVLVIRMHLSSKERSDTPSANPGSSGAYSWSSLGSLHSTALEAVLGHAAVLADSRDAFDGLRTVELRSKELDETHGCTSISILGAGNHRGCLP